MITKQEQQPKSWHKLLKSPPHFCQDQHCSQAKFHKKDTLLENSNEKGITGDLESGKQVLGNSFEKVTKLEVERGLPELLRGSVSWTPYIHRENQVLCQSIIFQNSEITRGS